LLTRALRAEETICGNTDLSKLDDEAERGLKKGMPKELDWFPFAQLPTVRWADSGTPVSTSIIHWFLLYGYKLKNAEANPTLRRYCSLFQKEDREKLGQFVLEAWIAKDTTPKYTSEQAAAEAQKIAQQTAAYAKQYPQYYQDFDEQRLYQSQFNWLLTVPEGSQNSTKGILAVAGACCGGDAAPVVHRYIKQWFGYRAAQCKALLQVLAWVDAPSATQVILSVANRFRTKGIHGTRRSDGRSDRRRANEKRPEPDDTGRDGWISYRCLTSTRCIGNETPESNITAARRGATSADSIQFRTTGGAEWLCGGNAFTRLLQSTVAQV